jgi:hypothetical protein
MATITEVTLGRVGHYRISRLHPDTSATQAAECECGATYTHTTDDPIYDGFCDWAMRHPAPSLTRATVPCAGSEGLIRVEGTDGNGVGWCPKCERYRPTTLAEGYEGWRKFDPHPVFTAVKP